MSKRPRIEMVPLIDCFFLLLVFFIFGVFSMEALTGALRQEASRQTSGLVVINADREVRHGLVMSVLDSVRQAGLETVSFHTMPEAQ
ncbi:MAG: biopolymer transporter ExbD [Candidatus Omnitrophica bacterium]|nr:biopolymer transporter ExbD [Candidatus Omnitrophota bacterium]